MSDIERSFWFDFVSPNDAIGYQPPTTSGNRAARAKRIRIGLRRSGGERQQLIRDWLSIT
jgi:hypothetical protein